MSFLIPSDWSTKPERWDITPEDVWWAAERLGIDPRDVDRVLPAWEGCGAPTEILTGSRINPYSGVWTPDGLNEIDLNNRVHVSLPSVVPLNSGSAVFSFLIDGVVQSNYENYGVFWWQRASGEDYSYIYYQYTDNLFYLKSYAGTFKTLNPYGNGTDDYVGALLFVIDGTNSEWSIYKDGTLLETVAGAYSQAPLGSAKPKIGGGSSSSGAVRKCRGAVFFQSALPTSIATKLTEDPHALIRRYPRPWVFDLGAGTTITVTDRGRSRSTLSLAASLALADSGAGADGPGLGAAIAAQDAGGGADAVAASAVIAAADRAAGAEGLGLAVSVALPEAGAGAEAAGTAAALTVADGATGADALAVLTAILKTITDAGAGGDVVGLSASIVRGDAGAGADAPVLQVALTVGDAGAGADAVSVLTAVLRTITDTAAGLETVAASAGITAADRGAGTDTPGLQVALSLADLGSGAEAVATLEQVLRTVADAASGTDRVMLSVSIPVLETGRGADTLAALQALMAVLEQGSGVEVVIRTSPDDPRRLVITFRGRSPSISASGRSPAITTTGRGPRITIN